jgi:hypothetical protein
MEITYESICEKLGCRPCDVHEHYRYEGHEDDSQPSLFRVLTMDEMDFLLNYYLEHGSFAPVGA